MKNKIALTIAAALFMFGAISCKKDYTCVCDMTVQGQPAPSPEAKLTKVTKKEAKDACDNMEATSRSAGQGQIGLDINCYLK